nr:immunoglobulin light chain junction region [Macaca mulatta]
CQQHGYWPQLTF